ncbi:MAG: 50S ribosomal protein L10 [Candidatus Thermoplasmatota archaeon]|jgi:large subunit ribosomal protein L10|nr:50S ribosomal protein L10 [Candidatus Thermoplasmatota archaeon]MCL5964030.1 50S ribosomal protein L10 [Candidatus Thermoplasmatota archaeon]
MRTKKVKIEQLSHIQNLAAESDVIAIVNFEGLPSAQFQEIRKSLRGMATIITVKNTISEKLFEKLKENKKNIEGLKGYLKGQSALIFSKKNAFILTKFLEQSKKKAPAKGGEVAEEDIVVKAADTSFKPGPIVGEMQKLGIPAAIDKGAVVIKKDAIVVKKGDIISPAMGNMLSRLSIFPVTVGLNINAAWEDDFIFSKESLLVDSDTILKQVVEASRNGMALAIDIEYGAKEVVDILLNRAIRGAMNLSVEIGYVTPANIKYLLQRAYRAGKHLNDITIKE